jgi:hypothetical protein
VWRVLVNNCRCPHQPKQIKPHSSPKIPKRIVRSDTGRESAHLILARPGTTTQSGLVDELADASLVGPSANRERPDCGRLVEQH